MKRIFSRLLLVLLAAWLSLPAAAAQEPPGFAAVRSYVPGQFYDVPEGQWFAQSVRTAYELGLMDGKSSTRFDPSGQVSVAEAVAIAARLCSLAAGGDGFGEPGDPWYAPYVDYAVTHGLLDTPPDSVSRPATRAETAMLLDRALPEPLLPAQNRVLDGAIPDISGADACCDAVYRLYRAGVLTGSGPSGAFRPDSGVTRAELAAMAARMAVPQLRASFTLTPLIRQGAVAYRITALQLTVEEVPDGGLSCCALAAIENAGSFDLYLGAGTFDVEDSTGSIVDSETYVSAHPSVIRPGETGYFYRKWSGGMSGTGPYRLVPTLDVRQASIPCTRFAVSEIALYPGADGAGVLGRVSNHTGQPEDITVIAVYLDQDGIPLGLSSATILQLQPGAEIGFDISGYDLPDNLQSSRIDRCVVYAEPWLQYQFDG